jgi:uncharacterized protein
MPKDASFLDTSGWRALLNSGDRNHASAVDVWREIIRRKKLVVLTDWIIAKTGNGLARSRFRELFVEALRLISTSPDVRIVFVDDDLLLRATDLYQARPNKHWGFVDCASFVVMTQEGISKAIFCDRHFEQAGFSRLLTEPEDRNGHEDNPVH